MKSYMPCSKRKWKTKSYVTLTIRFGAILDKDAADKLSKTVDEACLLLAEYNGRLAAELEDRRQLARMLTEYISSQREALTEREKKLEARHCRHNHTINNIQRTESESVPPSLYTV